MKLVAPMLRMLAVFLSALFVAPVAASGAENLAGDWIGTLGSAPGATRLALHIRATRGGLQAATDSPDQPGNTCQIKRIEAVGDRLGFACGPTASVYQGRWDPQTKTWVGTLTLGPTSIPIAMVRGTYPPQPTVEGLDGVWQGILVNRNEVKRPLAFHIATTERGTAGSVHSLDQGDARFLLSISRDDRAVVLASKAIGARFEGQLSADGKSIDGTWTQAGQPRPLSITWQGPNPPPTRSDDGGDEPPILGNLASGAPSDADILAILKQRIDLRRQGVGLVVGVIDSHGRRVVSYGALDQGDPRPIGGDTVFEIGSITKVFTSLLLANAVRRGEVALSDPASKYLPATVTMPQRDGKDITLVDLATHTSGLPRMPNNLAPKDPANPYADYSVDQFYQFLSGYKLTRDIGTRYEYSNLGGALLGRVLMLRAGKDYETLVRQRVLERLGMTSTAVALPPPLKARLAVGHAEDLKPVANWDLPTFEGAGSLRSTTNDLLTFLAAELGYRDTPLRAAMALQREAVRRPTGAPGMDVALAWHISTSPLGEVIWHNGGTGGYRTFIGFDPKAGVGVVVLSNVENQAGPDDIGFHILQPVRPVLEPWPD
jgi:D-alanyl-D-alanine-carboxypeptidase/D-alanyl-D-alanine-endopeptidase